MPGELAGMDESVTADFVTQHLLTGGHHMLVLVYVVIKSTGARTSISERGEGGGLSNLLTQVQCW